MNLKNLRVAIYARFSSDKQSDASIEDQVRRCREHVERGDGRIDADLVFTDHAISGASLARPGFEAMMSLVVAKPPRIDAIITEDISRISRDFADAAFIFKRLQFAGVQLVGVADGVDTSQRGGKMAFTFKSLMSDLYLDDLRDKTLRGMNGRALKGFSTGGLPYGYRSVPVNDGFDRVVGHKIEIVAERAAVIVWVFEQYLNGKSLGGIARELNRRQTEAPRARSKHRFVGWVDSTIRAMLHNPKYAGVWSFGTRQWVKEPGTGKRKPRLRDVGEVITQTRPELRIVAEETWQAVQERLRAVRAFYTQAPDGSPKGMALPSGKTHYPLSSILVCGLCKRPMVIYGGSSARYYRCGHNVKRGTCSNALAVREDVARPKILAEIRQLLASPAGVAYGRRRLVARMSELSRRRTQELDDHRKRLDRTEARIRGLIEFIASGDRSNAVVSALHDLEAQAAADKVTIADLERRVAAPIPLPSPDYIMKKVLDLEARLRRDPVTARESLRRLLKGGCITLDPQPDGFYIARSELLPLNLVLEPPATADPGELPGSAVYGSGSGGRI